MQKFHKQKMRWAAREIFRMSRKRVGQRIKIFARAENVMGGA